MITLLGSTIKENHLSFKCVKRDVEARELLSRVGDEPLLSEHVEASMEEFVLSKIYNCDEETCASARAAKWRSQRKKSTMFIPPDKDSLHHHFLRVNYITYCQKNFKLKDHPCPLGNGWALINGKCRPVRYTSPPLCLRANPNLVNVIETEDADSESDETVYDESSESDLSDQD